MRATPWTPPFLETAADFGREGTTEAVKDPDQAASAGGEAVRGVGPPVVAGGKAWSSQQEESRHAAGFAGDQLTPVIVPSGASDSDISVNIVSVSPACSTPGVSSSGSGASIGDEVVSKVATDSARAADADEENRDAHLQKKRKQTPWRTMENEMRALKRGNRELEKKLEQCKVKLKEI